jgi:hypothetical protein
MENLTLEQKQIIVSTNYYVGQFNNHIQEEAYGDTASYKILDRWISEVLDLDYLNDIYNNSAISQLNRVDSIKNAFKDKHGDWFVGDALKSSLYTLCYYNKNTPNEIEQKEQELKEIWAYFQSLLPKLPESKDTYVSTGVMLNGEMLYKKVMV